MNSIKTIVTYCFGNNSLPDTRENLVPSPRSIYARTSRRIVKEAPRSSVGSRRHQMTAIVTRNVLRTFGKRAAQAESGHEHSECVLRTTRVVDAAFATRRQSAFGMPFKKTQPHV